MLSSSWFEASEWIDSLYVLAGKSRLSAEHAELAEGRIPGAGAIVPLRLSARDAGEASRLKLAGDESVLLGCGGRGETSVVGGSENTSDGVSSSGVKDVCGPPALGGKAGRDLSTLGAGPADDGGFFDFLRRRAIRDSWQAMQKIPCEVRAYRKFSILRLQFLQRKQFAQKAWSPVKMARSSILFPQWLQL